MLTKNIYFLEHFLTITIDADMDFACFHLRTLTKAEIKIGILQE